MFLYFIWQYSSNSNLTTPLPYNAMGEMMMMEITMLKRSKYNFEKTKMAM